MTHEEPPKVSTVSADVSVKQGRKSSSKGRKKSSATIDEILVSIRERFAHIGEAIDKLERIEFYQEDESEKDATEELEHYLGDLYFKILGAFEILGLSDSLQEIHSRWEECSKRGLSHYSIDIHDGEPYINCPAVTVLRSAASILDLAVKREQIKERREEQSEAERREDTRTQLREQHAHEQIIRAEQHQHELRTQRNSSRVAVITVLLSLAFGNCDKFAGVFECSPSSARSSIVLSGALSTLGSASPLPVRVVCEPTVEGVFAAAGSGRYTVTIFPQVPLPLDLFCRGDSPGFQSEAVYVSIPVNPSPGRHGRPELHVPEIVMKPVPGGQEP